MFSNKLPVVVIVGRPNVGKSSLYNRLLKKRIAVTDKKEGTTRDSQYQELEWNNKKFVLGDTGGLMPGENGKLADFIRKQVKLSVAEAALVLFIVDAQTGPTDLDISIARALKGSYDKIIPVANKCDNDDLKLSLYEFLPLGLGEPFGISALHGTGAADLLDHIAARIPTVEEGAKTETVKIAILGRPNSGKSTLVNNLLGNERVLTDSKPGTTRDSVHSYLSWQDRNICLIDTAGLRKTPRVREEVEFYSVLRTEQIIEKCDVAVVMVDLTTGMQEQDLNVMKKAVDKGKGLLVAVNKWDLGEKKPEFFDSIVKDMRERASFLAHYPIISISALTGLRARRVLEVAVQIHDRLNSEFPQEELDAFLLAAVEAHQHPSVDNRNMNFFAIRQVPGRPLMVEMTVTNPPDVKPNYARFMENQFYLKFQCEGCPIRFRFVRKKKRGMKPVHLVAERPAGEE